MLEEIEEYARLNNIPIMQKDGIEYLCQYVKENNLKNILEIGTAIGYSAIKLALVSPDIHITSIEKDAERYKIAITNIEKMQLTKKITVIYGDALTTEVVGTFDLIFIDASKSHNIDFFNRYSHNLSENGTIITDNLSFHGLVEDESLAVTKNQRGIVKKIKLFIDFLNNNHDFNTIYIPVGDKISISKQKK